MRIILLWHYRGQAAVDGQPPEDSATGARDTDPQEAGVLDRTRR